MKKLFLKVEWISIPKSFTRILNDADPGFNNLNKNDTLVRLKDREGIYTYYWQKTQEMINSNNIVVDCFVVIESHDDLIPTSKDGTGIMLKKFIIQKVIQPELDHGHRRWELDQSIPETIITTRYVPGTLNRLIEPDRNHATMIVKNEMTNTITIDTAPDITKIHPNRLFLKVIAKENKNNFWQFAKRDCKYRYWIGTQEAACNYHFLEKCGHFLKEGDYVTIEYTGLSTYPSLASGHPSESGPGPGPATFGGDESTAPGHMYLKNCKLIKVKHPPDYTLNLPAEYLKRLL